jgi:hypothetical protein
LSEFLRTTLLVMAVVVGLSAAGWGIRASMLAQNAVMAPLEQQVKTNTFKHSQAHIDGVLHEIASMQREMSSASPEQKQLLQAMIYRSAATLPAGTQIPSLPGMPQ